MKASQWLAVFIAGLGIFGTLAATALALWGEAKRAKRTQQIETQRRQQDRSDGLQRERRDAIRTDYREILRFLARTRLLVLEMRARLAELEGWSAHASPRRGESRPAGPVTVTGDITRPENALPAVEALLLQLADPDGR